MCWFIKLLHELFLNFISYIDQWNKIESPEIIQAPMGTLALTKEARIYNGEKTISLTSGAGKTGQPLVKE